MQGPNERKIGKISPGMDDGATVCLPRDGYRLLLTTNKMNI